MPLTLRNAPVYLLTTASDPLTLRTVDMYLLVEDVLPLPQGISGYDAVYAMIQAAASETLVLSNTTLSDPEEEAGESTNSAVVLTAQPGSGFSGSVRLLYNRSELPRAFLGGVPVVIEGETTAHELLPKINAATGMVLEERDIENTAIVGASVTLTASATSYYFLPGSQQQVGG